MSPVTCNKHSFQQLEILIMTEESAVDLGRCWRWGKLAGPFLWAVIDVQTVSDKR